MSNCQRIRSWSFPRFGEAYSWAGDRGNGEFTWSGMLVRTKWTHFLSGSPQRLANSSAKMLFQGFHLLFTFSVGRSGPREDMRLQGWGRSGSEYSMPQRKAACGEEGAMLAQQDATSSPGCARASWPSRFTPATPILFDGVSLAFQFTFWKLKIWHMIPFI